MEAPVGNSFVQQGKGGRRGDAAADQSPAADCPRLRLTVACIELFSLAHKTDFDTETLSQRAVARLLSMALEIADPVELDGQYRPLREDAGLLERAERRCSSSPAPKQPIFFKDS